MSISAFGCARRAGGSSGRREVEHYHLESQTVGHHDSSERAPVFQKEVRMMRDQWGAILDSDPFYNPNLSLQDDKMALAFPPRASKYVVAD